MSSPEELAPEEKRETPPPPIAPRPVISRRRRKQEYKLHIGRYIWAYVYIFYVSYGVPLFIAALYLIFAVLPPLGIQFQLYPIIEVAVDSNSIFNQVGGFFSLFTQPSMATLAFISGPFVYIGLYLLHLYLTAFTGRQILRALERRVPAEEAVIERKFVDPDPKEFRKLIYYHSRNFILRVIKWKFTKGMFPWLQNWAFNYIGEHVGKGVTFEPEFFASELATYEDGAYIGPGALASSHVVEGVWGRIVILKVFMGKRSCACGKNIIGCGTVMDERSVLLPEGSLAKAFHLRANEYYDGVPAVRVLPKRLQREYFPGIKLPEIPESVLKEWGIEKKAPKSPKEPTSPSPEPEPQPQPQPNGE